MTLRGVTAGVVGAALLGVYLSWTAWVLPVGLAALAVGVLLRVLIKFAPARWVLLGAGLALLWLTVFGALARAPAPALESHPVHLQGEVPQPPEATLPGARPDLTDGEHGRHTVQGNRRSRRNRSAGQQHRAGAPVWKHSGLDPVMCF